MCCNCPLHRKLDKAIEATETIFRETTLAEMLSQLGSVTSSCEEKKEKNLVSLGLGSGKKNVKRKPTKKR